VVWARSWRVVARVPALKECCQSTTAKLQIVLLSARLLTLSHLSSLSPHRRPLVLLFRYISTLARYDLDYEVRDRARFVKGLLASGGIGEGSKGADMVMDVADFNRGETVGEEEDGEGEDEIVRTLTGDQVRDTLFAASKGTLAGGGSGKSTGQNFRPVCLCVSARCVCLQQCVDRYGECAACIYEARHGHTTCQSRAVAWLAQDETGPYSPQ
jgi:hypothetical protein